VRGNKAAPARALGWRYEPTLAQWACCNTLAASSNRLATVVPLVQSGCFVEPTRGRYSRNVRDDREAVSICRFARPFVVGRHKTQNICH